MTKDPETQADTALRERGGDGQAGLVTPPNLLKFRAGTGDKINPTDVATAKEAVEALAEEFKAYAVEAVATMRATIARVSEDRTGFEAELASMHLLALDIKSLGGTFDYPLVSKITESLYQFAEGRPRCTQQVIDLLTSHVDALDLVLHQDLKGDGGEIGRELVLSLHQAAEKHRRQLA